MKTCTVCQHPEIRAITGDLAARVPLRTIEGRYPGLSRSALDRHVQHVPKAVRLISDAAAIAAPVLGEMRKLNARALRILADVEETKDHATALTAIRECRRNLELIAKLTGELDPRAAGETPGGSLQVTINYVQKQNTIEMFPQVAASEEMPRAGESSPAIASLPRAEGDGGPECPR
jgi:hypothetical protein